MEDRLIVEMDYQYTIEIVDGRLVVYGCDCADSLEDLTGLRKLRDAVDELIAEKTRRLLDGVR